MFGVLIALIALSILILVHEFGHFIAAKMAGIWVEEFGIGLPPRVFGKKIGETIYSVNLLPIGGFVKLHGESGSEKVSREERAYFSKGKLAKALIALAGILMNFLLAVVIFTLFYFFSGIGFGVRVLEVLPGSPAQEAGILPADLVIKVDGRVVTYYDSFQYGVQKLGGKTVDFQVIRDQSSEVINLRVELPKEVSPTHGFLGILYEPSEVYFPKLWQRPFIYAYQGARKTGEWTARIAEGIILVFSKLLKGEGLTGVAGPVGIVATTAVVASYGFLPVLEFSALISINLALLNIVPFPPLDGSRVLFVGLEALFGKKMLPKIESTIHTVGMALLLLLMLALTISEIPKLLSAGSLSNFVDSVLQ